MATKIEKSFVYARGPYDTKVAAEIGRAEMLPHWNAEIEVVKLDQTNLEVLADNSPHGKWFAAVSHLVRK
jgi:hypothetical protein